MKRKIISKILVLIIMINAIICYGQDIVMYAQENEKLTKPVTSDNVYEKTEFYKEGPLGIIGGFHMVGFDTVKTKAHTNGNILAKNLEYLSSFGTNNFSKEVSYIQNISNNPSSIIAAGSNTDTTLVVGNNIDVSTLDNNNAWSLNGAKLDRPSKIKNPDKLWQDNTSKFIDLNKVENSSKDINQKIGKYENYKAQANFTDQNNTYIDIKNKNGVNVYNLDKDELNTNAFLKVHGFDKGKKATLIINVDMEGGTHFNIPGTAIRYSDGSSGSHGEVTTWEDGNVIWNFTDSTEHDGMYRGTINNVKETIGIILAPDAEVTLKSNLNGTVIANNIYIEAESHRNDFTGTTIEKPKEKPKNDISIIKVDEDDENIVLEDARFNLYEDSNKNEIYDNTDKLVGSYTTDKDGIINIKGLEYGTYFYQEIKSPEGYELDDKIYKIEIDDKTQNPLVIRVKNKKEINPEIEKISIPVEKNWVGESTDSVTINLLANGEKVEEVKLNDKNDWKHTFTNLAKFDEKGNKIVYTISEVKVDGYESTITGDMENGFVVTNTIKGKTSIGVTKKWIGESKDSVTINLLANNKIIETIELSDKNNWQYTFENLEKYDEKGKEIIYTISEVEIPGYESTINKSSENDYIVTNKNIEKISIPVKKNWVGESTDSVTINLLANGEKVQEVKLNDKNDWKHTFTNLSKFDEKGNKIVYTISEVKVDGYELTITGDMENGFVVTNTIKGKTSIGVTKKWIGESKDSVTINLLANNKIIETIELSDKNNWQYTFENLEKYDEKGKEIIYTISEVEIPGYESTINKSSENDYIVTNKNIEKISIPVKKNWVGESTDSVTINLLANGEKVQEVKLNDKNDWKHTFTDLAKFDEEGNKIVYTISEIEIPGYESTITGDIENGFVVTNTQIEVDVKINKVDKNNSSIKLEGAIFKVYRDTNNNNEYDKYDKLVGEYITDENGDIKIKDLSYGIYFYQEIKAPEGYELDDRIYTFEINEESNDEINLIVKNQKSTELGNNNDEDKSPQTGEETLIGYIIMSIISMLGIFHLRKNSN